MTAGSSCDLCCIGRPRCMMQWHRLRCSVANSPHSAAPQVSRSEAGSWPARGPESSGLLLGAPLRGRGLGEGEAGVLDGLFGQGPDADLHPLGEDPVSVLHGVALLPEAHLEERLPSPVERGREHLEAVALVGDDADDDLEGLDVETENLGLETVGHDNLRTGMD